MTRFAQSPCLPWRRIGADFILAPPGRDDFDQLSGTAAVAWSLLEEPSSLANLTRSLAEFYSVPPESITAEVGALVADLAERGAIQEIPCDP